MQEAGTGVGNSEQSYASLGLRKISSSNPDGVNMKFARLPFLLGSNVE